MRTFTSIVADGLGGFRRSSQTGEVRARLVAGARLRREADLRGASFWRRFLVEIAIEAEVRAEMKRVFPPDALYAAGARR